MKKHWNQKPVIRRPSRRRMNTFKRPAPIETQSILQNFGNKKSGNQILKFPVFEVSRPRIVNKESLSVTGDQNERNRTGSGDKLISGKVLFGTEKKPSILKNVKIKFLIFHRLLRLQETSLRQGLTSPMATSSPSLFNTWNQ